MTAKQKANQLRFKKVVAEAKKLRTKNPKLTQAQAVKQAWAIFKKTGKVGENHKDTKSHNVNIRVVSGVPISFTGQAGKVKFRVVRQIDIYGKVNASVEDIETGRYIVSADGKISAETLADSFVKYVKKVDPDINIKDVQKRMKIFFTQINKDIKDEQKVKAAAPRKTAAPKKPAARKTTTPKKVLKQSGGSSKMYDLRFQALPPGKRKSATGRTYYEYRANRSDQGKLLGIDNKNFKQMKIKSVTGIAHKQKEIALKTWKEVYGRLAAEYISAKTQKEKNVIQKELKIAKTMIANFSK
jgi:hypothetical protein